jgi:hypothetical protein
LKSLSTDAAAFALGVDRKTLDNILAREARSILKKGRRGRSRRIPIDALEQIAIALVLSRDLGVGVARGLQLAMLIVASPQGHIPVGTLGSLVFDLEHLRAPLNLAVEEAIEGIEPRTRGRPRDKKRT